MTLSALLCSENCSVEQFLLESNNFVTQKIPLSLFGQFSSLGHFQEGFGSISFLLSDTALLPPATEIY